MESNIQYLVDPNEALKEFYYDRRSVIGIMALTFIVQLLLTMLIIKYHISIFDTVKMIYPVVHRGDGHHLTMRITELHRKQIQEFIVVISLFNAAINILVFVFGLYAIYSKVLTHLQVFQVLQMIAILIDVLLTYLTIVNMFLLIIKCLLMFMTRNLITSLLTILILPLGAT